MPELWTDEAPDARRTVTARLQLADWRRRVARLYAEVRAESDPATGHARWRAGRDELFRQHPQSPLLPESELFETGLPYWPYDPRLRFEVPLLPAPDVEPLTLQVPTASDGLIPLRRIGQVQLPAPLDATLDVWWLQQYAGGIFLPLRDGSSGRTSYGGGRYLLDTAKSADLGGTDETLILDLNFLYHPSCRYNPAWECPLAQPGNTIGYDVQAGERLTGG
ncbi:hypothetical protein SAMN05444157_0517 [Frankineae bacterium MT45]|nr:hypothetical protein SAMN05444157_0517 [Frankineae bacterium MT45]